MRDNDCYVLDVKLDEDVYKIVSANIHNNMIPKSIILHRGDNPIDCIVLHVK